MDMQKREDGGRVGGTCWGGRQGGDACQGGKWVGGEGRVEVVGGDPVERRGQGQHPRERRTQVATHLTIMQGGSQGKQASMQTDKQCCGVEHTNRKSA